MAPKTQLRILETIVPKEYKKTFGLYQEEEPQFNLAAAPKKGQSMTPGAEAPMEPNVNPPAETPAEPAPEETEEPKVDKDKSSWLVKKLVGLLRYSGAMAVEVRGAIPDEAFEIVDKLISELENLSKALEPYLLEPKKEEPTEETPAEEPLMPEGEPTEEPAEEQPAEEKPKFKR